MAGAAPYTPASTGPPAGGIDPKLVEVRDQQRAEPVRLARAGAPAPLDPKLAEARERTIARERELKGRSTRQAPSSG